MNACIRGCQPPLVSQRYCSKSRHLSHVSHATSSSRSSSCIRRPFRPSISTARSAMNGDGYHGDERFAVIIKESCLPQYRCVSVPSLFRHLQAFTSTPLLPPASEPRHTDAFGHRSQDSCINSSQHTGGKRRLYVDCFQCCVGHTTE